MRTIRRQAYARDRRLALLQPRQGRCRCAAAVRTFAGCPHRACALPTRRTFRPVVAKTSQKPWLGTLRIPGFRIAAFLILRCNENCMVDQQVLAGPGDGPRRRSRRGMKKATCPKSALATAQKICRRRHHAQFSLLWTQNASGGCAGSAGYAEPCLARTLRLEPCGAGPGPTLRTSTRGKNDAQHEQGGFCATACSTLAIRRGGPGDWFRCHLPRSR